MTIEDLKILKNQPDSPILIKSKKEKWGKLIINHKIALPIDTISSYYYVNLDISIKNEAGSEVGALCFTRELGHVNWRDLTEMQCLAFITEASYNEREDDYKFAHNYLVINEEFYQEYIDHYMQSSSVWGGFQHLSFNSISSYKKVIPEITISKLNLRNDLFTEIAHRAICQPFAFERFLKFYHLLELRFDSEIVEDIQDLDFHNNPEKIGEILNNYNRTDFPRLLYLIEKHCNDVNSITTQLNEINNFPDQARDIFYKHGKETNNPLKEETKFLDLLPYGFDETELRRNSINFQNNYPLFIKKLTAYWIYRIRCSIAHSKIGEYILESSEENFIVEFGEPLLKNVILQCFK